MFKTVIFFVFTLLASPLPAFAQAQEKESPVATWTEIPAPPIDFGFANESVLTSEYLLILGGPPSGVARQFDRGAIFDIRKKLWTKIPDPPTTVRFSPRVVWTGGSFIVWGKKASDDEVFAGAIFDPQKSTWKSVPASRMTASDSNSCFWSGKEMIVVGGSIAAYNPETDTWRTIEKPTCSILGSPEASSGPSSILFWESNARRGAMLSRKESRWQQIPQWTWGEKDREKRREKEVMVYSDNAVILWGGERETWVRDSWAGAFRKGLADGAVYDIGKGAWERIPEGPINWDKNCWASLVGNDLVVMSTRIDSKTTGARFDLSKKEWRAIEALQEHGVLILEPFRQVGDTGFLFNTGKKHFFYDIAEGRWFPIPDAPADVMMYDKTVGSTTFCYGLSRERKDIRYFLLDVTHR